jgi:hypothetical protein
MEKWQVIKWDAFKSWVAKAKQGQLYSCDVIVLLYNAEAKRIVDEHNSLINTIEEAAFKAAFPEKA